MAIRDKDKPLRRRAAYLSPKHRMLIVCEGKVTEPEYFRKYQHAVRNRLVHVETVGPAGVPLSVVQRAIEIRDAAACDAKAQRDENLSFDETWCVFDVDDHPRLAEAITLAADREIECAVSNPSFELWALLHYQDQTTALHRDEARRELKAWLPNYDKSLPFEKLHRGYAEAVQRASELERRATSVGSHGAWQQNPSTGVFRLTERIRAIGAAPVRDEQR